MGVAAGQQLAHLGLEERLGAAGAGEEEAKRHRWRQANRTGGGGDGQQLRWRRRCLGAGGIVAAKGRSMAGPGPKLASWFFACVAAAAAHAADVTGQSTAPIVNPAIDPVAFLRVAGDALAQRERRRVSEAEFVRMRREPGTVVLDARSKARYDQLHVEGALHLSFPDIAIESLAALLPDKDVRILIYCNNNFRGAEGPFPKKLASASLNLSTFVALYDYGYRNVWELGPLIDVETSTIPFARGVPATP